MTRRREDLPLVGLVALLLGIALWRGHVLVERSARPVPGQVPRPTPAPAPRPPREVTIVATIAGMDLPEAVRLGTLLTGTVDPACPGSISGPDPVLLLEAAVTRPPAGGSPPPMVCFLSDHPKVHRFRGMSNRPGVHILSRAEAPDLADAVIQALNRSPTATLIWVHFRDLATPPPHPRRELRWLRRHGFGLPDGRTLHHWLERPDQAPPGARQAARALNEARLARLASALRRLASPPQGTVLRLLLVLGAGDGAGRIPRLAAGPGATPCPGLSDVLAPVVRSAPPVAGGATRGPDDPEHRRTRPARQ